MKTQKVVDLGGKQFENLTAKNHEHLPRDLQIVQDEKKQHTWEKNEDKHLIGGHDYNIDDLNRKEVAQREVKKEGELNWNQSINQPWTFGQNNTQSIMEDKNSIQQNQSREVPLNNPQGVAISHKRPEDNKGKTREEAGLKSTVGAPPPAKLTTECCEPLSQGPAPGSQKQNLTGKDLHREQERDNMKGIQYEVQGQKELVTKASKKETTSHDIQGPKWVAGVAKNEETIQSKDKDFQSSRPIDAHLSTGYEKNETDIIKENKAQQDTAHGK